MTADELDEEYRRNDYDDKLVQAFNTLNDDDRDTFLKYIQAKCKIAKTSRILNTTPQRTRERIEEIRDAVMKEYERILSELEETDERIGWYRRRHTKPKRPVVRAELFDWIPIAKYESIEEAANAVNGNANRILNVCNEHSFKYKNTRWFFETDWNKKKLDK